MGPAASALVGLIVLENRDRRRAWARLHRQKAVFRHRGSFAPGGAAIKRDMQPDLKRQVTGFIGQEAMHGKRKSLWL